MNLHDETLPINQQKTLRELGKAATSLGFYPGGAVRLSPSTSVTANP